MRRVNLAEPSFQYDEDDPPGFRNGMFRFGARLGAEQTGASLYELSPGQALCPYHYEYGEEEWLLVVSGRPSLRHPGGTDELEPWDMLCFPRGPDGAHQVRNDSDEPARVLMWSTVVVPTATVYPDSDKIGIWTGRSEDDLVVRRTSGVAYYDGETPEAVIAGRLRPFGTTIFTEMSALALRSGALNLGQGFPDTDGPREIMQAATDAMASGRLNQYAPLAGVPELCSAIAEHQQRRYDAEVDPADGVQVTFGATEAIAATMLGLLEPGDAVVVLEPFYDSYAATIAMAGARRRLVTMRPPDFAIDVEALDAAARGARMLLLNSPHNPTGRVLARAELEAIARTCVEHDLVAVADEVYEHLAFDGEHVPLATLPEMAERTLTISSAGKSFSLTGWKVGWCSGPPRLVAGVRAAKQFLSFAGGTPLQHAIAGALDDAERHTAPLRASLRARRDLLCEGLRAAGFGVTVPQGGYFVQADLAPLGVADGAAWCRELPARAGVVAIPTSAFYDDAEAGRTLARFAFCKRAEVLEEAVARLSALTA